VNLSPLSLSEVARRRRALQPQLQPFWSPEQRTLRCDGDEIDEVEEAQA
jgi:hypothetical protein